jgi:hypothetical protein
MRGDKNPAEEKLARYGSPNRLALEDLTHINNILNPPPHWVKNLLFCTIAGVALVSAFTGAYIILYGDNKEKTLQTGGLLVTGSLTSLIGIVAGSKL